MDKRERLFKMLVEANYMVAGDVVPRSPAERLYAIVDYLFAHGVEIPPCKVGDTVYIICPKQGIVERKVKRFQLGKYGLLLMVYGEGMNVNRLGTHFFLTKEEAKKAIEERSLESV